MPDLTLPTDDQIDEKARIVAFKALKEIETLFAGTVKSPEYMDSCANVVSACAQIMSDDGGEKVQDSEDDD